MEWEKLIWLSVIDVDNLFYFSSLHYVSATGALLESCGLRSRSNQESVGINWRHLRGKGSKALLPETQIAFVFYLPESRFLNTGELSTVMDDKSSREKTAAVSRSWGHLLQTTWSVSSSADIISWTDREGRTKKRTVWSVQDFPLASSACTGEKLRGCSYRTLLKSHWHINDRRQIETWLAKASWIKI